MKLHEIADNDFEEPERTPVQMYDRVVNRAAKLRQHEANTRLFQEQIYSKLNLNDIEWNWNYNGGIIGVNDSDIQAKKDEGYFPLIRLRASGGPVTKVVQAYIKITPQNQSLIKQLHHANKMYLHAQEAAIENDKLIKRYKAKWQAWVRKQPGYVKRDEAKDHAKELASDIMAFCKSQFMMEPNLIQQNFWKKGNKFVVQLGFHEKPQNGKTLWNKLKEIIIPQLKDHLKSNGLVGSIKTDYHSPDATDLTMFIDAQEVLAKQKDDNEDI